jgi:hypothetical protein
MGPGAANAWHGPRGRPRRGLTTRKFRGSITQRLISLSTLRRDGHPSPRKTRFRLLARLCRTGLVTRRVPIKGFTFEVILLFRASWRKDAASFARQNCRKRRFGSYFVPLHYPFTGPTSNQRLLDAVSFEEAIEDRQSAHPTRQEGVPLGACRFPWPSCILVLIHVSRSRDPCCERVQGRLRASEARRCRRPGRSVLRGHDHRAKVRVKSKKDLQCI